MTSRIRVKGRDGLRAGRHQVLPDQLSMNWCPTCDAANPTELGQPIPETCAICGSAYPEIKVNARYFAKKTIVITEDHAMIRSPSLKGHKPLLEQEIPKLCGKDVDELRRPRKSKRPLPPKRPVAARRQRPRRP